MKVTERIQLGDPICLDKEGVCMCMYAKSSKYKIDTVFTIFVFTIQALNVLILIFQVYSSLSIVSTEKWMRFSVCTDCVMQAELSPFLEIWEYAFTLSA